MATDVKVTVQDNSDATIDEMLQACERALVQIGILAEGYAKEELNRPKKHKDGSTRPNIITGRLWSSITYATPTTQSKPGDEAQKGDAKKLARVPKNTVVIGTNVEYAPDVEYGGDGRWSYPYLRPAIEKHKDQYKQIIKDELGD